MTASRPPLCLTQGDPSGVGPDITLTLYSRSRDDGEPFLVLADPGLLRRRAERLGLPVEVVEAEPEQAAEVFPSALPVLALKARVAGEPGQPDPADAPATIESIARAVELVHAGRACAVVTNPIAKSVLYRAGFAHPGHTEYLGELARKLYGRAVRPVMLLWSRELAVVPATIHVPLAQVPALLTTEDLVEIGEIVAEAFRRDFGIARPRLVFAGLNPHAGEDGAIGREDIEIIAPAVARLAARGHDVRGPLPADTMFHAAARETYDVAICAYHDQALIPIKTLAFDSGVNVTLGLPFIRTSPDHGTAFAIAGTGAARDTSLAEATALAARMARARA
ncbi:4-hydroxythreonine-4-phosphate dehydrogenase PdxA [Rhodoblastus acidophilus]|uniref:4-hydroxythreonine-4-phosphate dehydrogenase n=1 Tax=Candidatus Rhodoblastus alkanivorans TaxID=2954117 RepID=A0ABS9Z8T4_9HYPH|nr:4-hydroxythreonine-4-phosphate dehydrogenase PdxA [Candidatus Rhodoblastus alkanivorans]MCI4678743.1 4-hydroxythreonine-4-phosphate dehydrogenase PdxA [Candidatus Rhodoblastus alkanivorans]MCI4683461.1 4-hydroxythreonine-4-phosphate dehydrogenase PdxA [Candidatus Rhodoblastus alkanivorans]MDI4640775.1 4-hydroxythreonine-4-phosphate dehydrogenase PdxA [Rhodoblastus acidophilus]